MSRDHDVAQQRRLEVFRSVTAERVTRLNLSWIQFEQGSGSGSGGGSGVIREFLREIHTLKGEASLMGFANVVSVAHSIENLLRPVAATDERPPPDLGDRILNALDLIAQAIANDATAPMGGLEPLPLPAEGKAGEPPVPAPEALDAPRGAQQRPRLLEAVRVSADKLDRLRDIVGELLLMRARLETSAAEVRRLREITSEQRERLALTAMPLARELGVVLETVAGIESRLRADGHRVDRVVSELDDTTRELRMVPIRSLYEHYPRATRALARDLGREVRLELEGESIEVDRAVLDRIGDPLLHLIRNAVDHGIEPPDARRAAGKPSEGSIRIRAELKGRLLQIEVSDDGAGIDVDRVRERVVELGLLGEQAVNALDDPQVLRWLFSAGLSTRNQVTELSGRGIGLHVAQTDIESLGGMVDLSTELGRGTRFKLTAPVTMARSSMLVFRVRRGRYALPSSCVVTIVDAGSCEHVESVDGPCIRHQGALVPVVPLDGLLGETANSASKDQRGERILIVHDGRNRLALAATSHHGEHEVVLKPMGRLFEQQRLISAAAPLGDGSLALVLTIGEIFSLTRTGELGRSRRATPEGPARRRKTVLVVDDSPVVRDLISEALRSHGMRVVEAGDGLEAIAQLAVHDDIDLVITDLDMPKLDGVGLVRHVRGRTGPRLPVIVVTMRGSDEDKSAAIDAGADSYLVKNDLSHGGLWKIVERMLG